MTGGAFGSMFAQLFHLTAAERKTLLVAGAAAGMSAVFATPIAAVLLAVELLLFEWKPRSFIPVAVAAILAAVVAAFLASLVHRGWLQLAIGCAVVPAVYLPALSLINAGDARALRTALRRLV